MPRVPIAELKEHLDSTVELRGWAQAIRDQKSMQFLVLRDETGLAQLVLAKQDPPSELNEAISALTPESAVTIAGLVVADERVKLGGLEIQLASLTVDSPAEPELPVTPESALDKRIDWRYLDLRRPDRRLIFEVQSTVEYSMREYWRRQGFVEIHTPKLMGSASESGAELFKVDYFERTAYLAQSPQFYKQMAMAGGFGKVFEIGPVFRANPSFTSRHDTEFTSVDVEIAWIDSHEDVMAFEEAWLAHVLSAVAREHGEQIASTFGVELSAPTLPFPRITLAEAKALLAEHGHEGAGPSIQTTIWIRRASGPCRRSSPSGQAASSCSSRTIRRPCGPSTTCDIRTSQPSPRASTCCGGVSSSPPEPSASTATSSSSPRRVRRASRSGRSSTTSTSSATVLRRTEVSVLALTRLLMQMLGQDNVREVTFLYRGPNRLEP